MRDWRLAKLEPEETATFMLTAIIGGSSEASKVSFGTSQIIASADTLDEVQRHIVAILDLFEKEEKEE